MLGLPAVVHRQPSVSLPLTASFMDARSIATGSEQTWGFERQVVNA